MIFAEQPRTPKTNEVVISPTNSVFAELKFLHNHQRISFDSLPPDYPYFPGQAYSIKPYYMLWQDPPELGKWKITVGNDDSGEVFRVASVGSNDGIVLIFTATGEAGREIEASSEETEALKLVLDHWSQQLPPLEERFEPKSRRRLKHKLASLISKSKINE